MKLSEALANFPTKSVFRKLLPQLLEKDEGHQEEGLRRLRELDQLAAGEDPLIPNWKIAEPDAVALLNAVIGLKFPPPRFEWKDPVHDLIFSLVRSPHKSLVGSVLALRCPYASREYQDTFPFPAPSSVYGMLLSFLGVQREDKAQHRGVEMALAVHQLPGVAKVFRKLRRGADLENTRPDYQDLLMDLQLWIWLRIGTDTAQIPMAVRVPQALASPTTISRCGGLSLGESSYLVDSIKIDPSPPKELIFLIPDKTGFYSMPVWVDHTDARNTVPNRFRLTDPIPISSGLAENWIRIGDRLP